MASRKDQKEQLRRERLEREASEQAAAQRTVRLKVVGAGALVLLASVLVVIGIVALVSGGGADEQGPAAPSPAAELPAQLTTDVREAARAARCTLTSPDIEGAEHEDREFRPTDYRTNPPTSGPHTPDWYEDGVYAPGDSAEIGMTVHPLEHGRIVVQYRPGTARPIVEQLEAIVAEDGYHKLLLENGTGMTPQVAATAWGQSLTCAAMNPKVVDAVRTFSSEYVDQGPEQVP